MILCINTANDHFYISLADGTNLIAEDKDGDITIASKKIHSSIQKLLSQNSLRPSDLTRIHIINGPGSYTGLRVGLAAAKGLAYALNIPIIPISYLDFISFNVKLQLPDYKNYITCFAPMKGEIIYNKYIDNQITEYHIITNTENIPNLNLDLFVSNNNADKVSNFHANNIHTLKLNYSIMHLFPEVLLHQSISNINDLEPSYIKSTYIKK